MAQKPAGTGTGGGEIFRALVDFLILTLLVIGSGFGGYYFGIHERLAPVQNVAPGTPGALPASAVLPTAAPGSLTIPKTTEQAKPAATPPATPASPAQNASVPAKSKRKFWLASTGMTNTGNNITVSVNDNPVDNFFMPGKSIDITSLIKPGDNTVTFDTKALAKEYNKHPGDKRAELKVQVVSGSSIQENFKPSDVLSSYKRNATQTEDNVQTEHFDGGE